MFILFLEGVVAELAGLWLYFVVVNNSSLV